LHERETARALQRFDQLVERQANLIQLFDQLVERQDIAKERERAPVDGGEPAVVAFEVRLRAHVAARSTTVRQLATYCHFFFFFTLVTGTTRSLSLKLSDTRVYEPQI